MSSTSNVLKRCPNCNSKLKLIIGTNKYSCTSKKKDCGIHTNRGICGRKGYLCGECKQEIKRKNKPREHNIELSGRLSENCITIKGNKLNLKWLGKSILVWSEEND